MRDNLSSSPLRPIEITPDPVSRALHANDSSDEDHLVPATVAAYRSASTDLDCNDSPIKPIEYRRQTTPDSPILPVEPSQAATSNWRPPVRRSAPRHAQNQQKRSRAVSHSSSEGHLASADNTFDTSAAHNDYADMLDDTMDFNGEEDFRELQSALEHAEQQRREQLDMYYECIQRARVTCARLTEDIWVVEDWDKSGYAHFGVFHHVTRFSNHEFGCSCRNTRDVGIQCLHVRLLSAHLVALEARFVKLSSYSSADCIAFQWQHADGLVWYSVLSSRSKSGQRNQQRSIVVLKNRIWRCVKCNKSITRRPITDQSQVPNEECVHIRSARKEHAEQYPDEEQDEEDDGSDAEEAHIANVQLDTVYHNAAVQTEATSFLPISLPRFVRSTSDTSPLVPAFTPQQTIFFALDGDSARCRECKREGGREELPVLQEECWVFTSQRAYRGIIEVQECNCRRFHRKTIGPDLRRHGCFNWSNSIIFTHELLHRHVIEMVHSPTPLSAFSRSMSAVYVEFASPKPFVSRDTFRKAWFAFADKLELNTVMTCDLCGPTPQEIIGDGVSIAFKAKYRSSALAPPTLCHPQLSANRAAVRPLRPGPQLFSPQTLRSSLKQALRLLKEGDGIDELELVCEKLEELESTVAKALVDYLRKDLLEPLTHANPPTADHINLLIEWITQISAHESLICFCSHSALAALRNFLAACENTQQLTRLQHYQALRPNLPSLYRLLQSMQERRIIPTESFHILLYRLCGRIEEVHNQYQQMQGNEDENVDMIDQEHEFNHPEAWKKTGSHYGAPIIRFRPYYPRIPDDHARHTTAVSTNTLNAVDKADNQPVCSKFYKFYTERKQTGGIFALWCRHLVCVGWHVIPKAEGRDDIFSAIFTRWHTAPNCVCYDFACAAGPYAFLREYEFFKNTLWGTDGMHAQDHKKCSTATYMTNWMGERRELKQLNTVGAECRNAGLDRIRKSVRYCSEAHAILYTGVFMSVSNRIRRLEIKRRQQQIV